MSAAYPVKGGPWDGKVYASHEPRAFTVHERRGAIVVAHHYKLNDLPGHKPFWRYAGKTS